MARKVKKQTRSAKVDVAKLRRVRRFLKAKTDSEAIAKAIEYVDESNLLHDFIKRYGGRGKPEDWEDYDVP